MRGCDDVSHDEPLTATELTILRAYLRRYEANHATTAQASQVAWWLRREVTRTRERVLEGTERRRG